MTTQIPMQMIALGLLITAAHLCGKLFKRFKLSDISGMSRPRFNTSFVRSVYLSAMFA